MKLRNNHPVLTYEKRHEDLVVVCGTKQANNDGWSMRSLWLGGSLFMAGVLVTLSSATQSRHTPLGEEVVRALLRSASPPPTRHSRKNKIIPLSYSAPEQGFYDRTLWTIDEFWVQGVNLAQYGFEATNPSVSTTQRGYFELYEDFDISVFLENDSSHDKDDTSKKTVSHWLMFHRHLSHPSLAFYIDKIAQKRYWESRGTPTPKIQVLKYQHELSPGKEEASIQKLLPDKTDYVIKASHRRSSSIMVAYDDQSHRHTMGTKGHVTADAYNVETISHRMTRALHTLKPHFLDPWSMQFVSPGVVVEDRITGLDSVLSRPAKLQVYLIWGRVWMASWFDSINTTSGGENNNNNFTSIMYRNGTRVVINQQHEQMIQGMPDWMPWETIVKLAEDLGSHKDLCQVNILVGMSAEASKTLVEASPEEKKNAIQAMVVDVHLDPDVNFPDVGLLNEMGRLWIAGYQMGIFRTVSNDEVPKMFVKHTLNQHHKGGQAQAEEEVEGISMAKLIRSALRRSQ